MTERKWSSWRAVNAILFASAVWVVIMALIVAFAFADDRPPAADNGCQRYGCAHSHPSHR